MDMAVDQARKDGLVPEVDDRRARFGRRDMAVLHGDNPAIVDDDRRRSTHRLPRNRDQSSSMDVSGRCRRRHAQSGKRRPNQKFMQTRSPESCSAGSLSRATHFAIPQTELRRGPSRTYAQTPGAASSRKVRAQTAARCAGEPPHLLTLGRWRPPHRPSAGRPLPRR